MQVPADKENRKKLVEATGQNSIPALILEDGEVITGEDDVLLDKLNEHYSEPAGAKAHKEKDRLNYPKKF